MEWLERNLEAYRLLAQVLNELRSTLRLGLERIHGEAWFRIGLPNGMLDRLIEAKEHEKAIDWYESEYQEVIDYALFPDLFEVIELNAEHFPSITRLAPSLALLHARFLELEVIRGKLGRTRPVSDGEVAFLGTFHSRFETARTSEPSTAPPPSLKATKPAADSASEIPPTQPAADDEEPADNEDAAAAAVDPAPTKARRGPKSDQNPPRREATRPPQRSAQVSAAAQPAPSTAPDPQPTNGGPPSGKRPSLLQSLESGDSRSVLRELYREVTTIADGIWTSGTAPSTPLWDAVSTSSWYEQNFSKAGLRPLSDFYEVVSQVTTRIDDGVARPELQKFLKDNNFAQVLLALRDMFQRAGI